MGVATHGRLIDRNLTTSCLNQSLQFRADDRQQPFRQRVAIRVLLVRDQAAAQGVRAGNAGFECRAGRRKTLKTLKIFHCAQSSRRSKRAHDFMFAALIVGRRSEAARRGTFQLDSFEETIERKIEIEAGLFAVGDYIQARFELVVDSGSNSIVDEFPAIVSAKLIEMIAREFEPPWERIAADDRRAQRMVFHEDSPRCW